eukprot:scaffold1667_cov258-Pinguiococcus_pyrenoidosus.AAC.9
MWTPASAPGRVSTERAPTAMRAAMPADEVSTAQDKRVPSEVLSPVADGAAPLPPRGDPEQPLRALPRPTCSR